MPAEIDDNYHPETELIGDLAHTLWMLNERVSEHGLPDYDLELQKTCRADMAADFAEHKDDSAKGAIKPQKALWDARQVMGRKTYCCRTWARTRCGLRGITSAMSRIPASFPMGFARWASRFRAP